MIVALYMLLALVVVGALLYRYHKLTAPGPDAPQPEDTAAENSDNECCGMHITCERDSLLASVSPTVVYYDDEELDIWRGTAASDYPDEAVEQFRDVLLTLLPDDIAGWARSLQLRGIELPLPVRDELLMIVAETRASRAKDHD